MAVSGPQRPVRRKPRPPVGWAGAKVIRSSPKDARSGRDGPPQRGQTIAQGRCGEATRRSCHGKRRADLAAVRPPRRLAYVPVRRHALPRPQSRDPNDEMVLEAAVNGGAELIATFNLADYLPAATRCGTGTVRE
ncbi:PIN domain-containing protein [uncultured Thiodictyon sp.]|uniref:PIN domain-containing protein n=1 Tax=uncultured Thiodictyon sp. TaxID=1846217 RepID=UPI00345A688A